MSIPKTATPVVGPNSVHMTLNANVVDVDREHNTVTLRFDAQPLPDDTLDMLTELFPNTQVGLRRLLDTETVVRSIR